MFTIKASYRNETRKFSFPSNTFPSFNDIQNQLYRVFPISHDYFLSKLLFSPDSSLPSRIMIGKEVHSENEYNTCITTFHGLSWSNALLRFSVYDETPHKLPSATAPSWGTEAINLAPWRNQEPQTPQTAFSQGPPKVDTPAQPPISLFHIPPPPIIYSISPTAPRALDQAPMDVDPTPHGEHYSHHNHQGQESHHTAAKPVPSNIGSCCAFEHGKSEVQTLFDKFKKDLDSALMSTFGPCNCLKPENATAPTYPSVSHPPLPVTCLYKYCTSCAKIFQGPWYSCQNCNTTLCVECNAKGLPFTPCFYRTGSGSIPQNHVMQKETCFACPQSSTPVPSSSQPAQLFSPTPPLPPKPHNPGIPSVGLPGFWPSSYSAMMHTPYFPGPETFPSVVPFIPPSPSPSPVQWFRRVGPQFTNPIFTEAPQARALPVTPPAPMAVTPPPPPPVIHTGVLCDLCETTIEGVRHKCLDCADYDLCTACIEAGAAEEHNPFHEFFDIREPGRVVVHTVFSGNGERSANTTPERAHPASAPVPVPVSEPAVHNATCDLCDSRIRGDRYKCMNCPDFDSCSTCFTIIPDQHPSHTFVKVSNPADYIRPNAPSPLEHLAKCNGCHKRIYGIRYKCMHPDCPDFDLCANCEALPIPVHPENHPLLKMKSIDTVVPTVYRVGNTTLIPRDDTQMRGRTLSRSQSPVYHHPSLISPPSPAPIFGPRSRSPPRSRSRSWSPSYRPRSRSSSGHDYMHDLSAPNANAVGQIHVSPISPVMRGMRYTSPERLPRRVLPIPPLTFNPPPRWYAPPSWASSPSARYASVRGYSPGSRSPSPSRIRAAEPTPIPYNTRSPSSFSRRTAAVNRSRFSSRSSSRSYVPPIYFDRSRSNSRPRADIAVPAPIFSRSAQGQRSFSRASSPLPSRPRSRSPSPLTHALLAEAPVATIDQSAEPAVAVTGSEIPSGSRFELPPLSLGPTSDFMREMIPRVAQELKNLMLQETSQNTTPKLQSPVSTSGPAVSTEATIVAEPIPGPSVTDSPLTSEPLLNRPLGGDDESNHLISSLSLNRSLAALLNAYPTLTPSPPASITTTSTKEIQPITPAAQTPPPRSPLQAAFMADVTVPDGQIFPPGAEFVKAWRILNDSDRDWPEATELVFVAGEALGVTQNVKVGSVGAGTEIDLWTGELKAPDAPGRYVGYWRLKDDEGNLFGNSFWIDITVAETSHRSERSSDSSLASSSIVIMPGSAPSIQTSAAAQKLSNSSMAASASASASSSASIVTAPSSPHPIQDDAASDGGSDSSSVSLVSVPTSEDEEDVALWEASRSQVVPVALERPRGTNAMEYVVLYDDISSDEE